MPKTTTFSCFAILTLWGSIAMSATPVSQTRSFLLGASCERAFPMFTPLGERAWAPGWKPHMLSGEKERGSVFRTRHPNGAEATWVVTDYDPARHHVAYARLVDGSNMGLVEVRCTPAGQGSSIEVTYTLTAVSESGKAFVEEFLS